MAARSRPGTGVGARLARLAALAGGAPTVLPRPLDALAERWARLGPRLRATATVALVALVVLGVSARVQAIEQRWGGAPVPVLVATETLPVGVEPSGLRRAAFPPAVAPPDALADVPPGAVLAFALPEGAVLTATHLDERGPSAGLPPTLRVVPIPVEEGWGVTPGGRVDVWVLGDLDTAATLVARSRPVLDVTSHDLTRTALVGLAVDEVAEATAGVALGRILLTHAPAP